MDTTTDTKPAGSLSSVTLEVADVEEARRFYAAFGVDTYIRLRARQVQD
ncbi:glyoxalase, partial [Streptomyces sp. DT225]